MPNKPVKLSDKEIFDPEQGVANVGGTLPGSREDSTRGKINGYALGNAIGRAVQYAYDNIEYANETKEYLLAVYEQERKLRLEVKTEQIKTALQNAFLNNNGDLLKCNEAWNTILTQAKADEQLTSIIDAASIENYVNNVVQSYRVGALKNAILQNNADYRKVCEFKIQNRQKDLDIAYSMMANEDPTIRQNGFLLYSNAVHEMTELFDATNGSGEPVFGEADKLIISQQNKDILGAAYSRVQYAKQPSFIDKIKFIESIGNGTLSVDAKDFFKGFENFTDKEKDGELGVFHFYELSYKSRKELVNELKEKYLLENKEAKKARKKNLVQSVLSGEEVAMPSSEIYRQGVRNYYDGDFRANLLGTLNSDDSDKDKKILQMHRDFIGKLRFIPSGMLDFVRSLVIHPDPQRVLIGCDLVDLITSEFSGARLDDPNGMKGMSVLLFGNRLSKSGTPPDIVANFVRQMENTDEATRKMYQQEFYKKTTEDDYKIEKIIKEVVPSFFNKSPIDPFVAQSMRQDYINIVQAEYVNTRGDEASAKKLAVMLMKQKWGETNVNGKKEVVPFPPEDFWCTQEFPRETLRQNMLRAAMSHLYLQYDEDGVKDLGELFFYPDDTTAREILSGQMPTYRIVQQDKYGIWHDVIYGKEERISLDNVMPPKLKETSGYFDADLYIRQLNRLMALMSKSEIVRHVKDKKDAYAAALENDPLYGGNGILSKEEATIRRKKRDEKIERQLQKLREKRGLKGVK